MKRLLLTVFAAAMTAAIAVPAMAEITLSGQLRERGEYRNNATMAAPVAGTDFNDAVADSRNYWAQRLRLTANAKATDDVSVKATLQDTRIWGSGLITQAGAFLSIHEGYLNVTNFLGQPITLRAGRQELAYGDERLIGAFGWSNYGRAFDGFKFMYSTDAVNVDAFAMNITENTGVSTNSTTGATTLSGLDNDRKLYGVYATLKQLIPNNSLDVYILDDNDLSTDITRYTIGARLKGSVAGLDYTVEVPWQTGTDGEAAPGGTEVDLTGWALAVKGSYAIPGAPMGLKVGAEYDLATGDDPATATENEAFNQLFPTNHDKFGIGDFTPATNTWSNIQAWNINASADATPAAKLYVAYWSYSVDEPAVGAPDDLGTEIDLIGTYKYNSALSIEAGFSRFMPGDATVASTVPQDPADWAYLQLLANF